jgi:hypothetical protein
MKRTERSSEGRGVSSVHRVSLSQLTQDPDRVRSFGGYNMTGIRVKAAH